MPVLLWALMVVGWVAACVIAVPCLVLVVEVLAGMLPLRGGGAVTESRPRVAVLIPAHDEEAGIGATIAAVRPQMVEGDRLIVIADNCTDGTAEVARSLGAEALERCDAVNRGKGFALGYGVEALRKSPPDVVVVIDADMVIEPGSIDRLARMAAFTNQPVQALDLLDPPADPSARDLVSCLAFTIRNGARPRGLRNLGLPCQLMGTGMAVPWAVLQHTQLSTGSIVEDMRMGLDLAMKGFAARFCPEAKVKGRLPQQSQAAAQQRTRWEHGHVATILHEGPRLLMQAVKTGRVDLLAVALDLTVPPLSMLVMLLLAQVCVAGAVSLAGGGQAMLGVSAALLCAVAVAVVAGWWTSARETISAGALLAVPMYLVWKAPIYLKLLRGGERRWVRTERDGAPDKPR